MIDNMALAEGEEPSIEIVAARPDTAERAIIGFIAFAATLCVAAIAVYVVLFESAGF